MITHVRNIYFWAHSVQYKNCKTYWFYIVYMELRILGTWTLNNTSLIPSPFILGRYTFQSQWKHYPNVYYLHNLMQEPKKVATVFVTLHVIHLLQFSGAVWLQHWASRPADGESTHSTARQGRRRPCSHTHHSQIYLTALLQLKDKLWERSENKEMTRYWLCLKWKTFKTSTLWLRCLHPHVSKASYLKACKWQ